MNNLEFVKNLIKSTAEYTVKNIEGKENKEFYEQGIIDSIRQLERGENLAWAYEQIKHLNDRSYFMQKNSFFGTVRPRLFYTLALSQALNAISSIEMRFNWEVESVWVKNKYEW